MHVEEDVAKSRRERSYESFSSLRIRIQILMQGILSSKKKKGMSQPQNEKVCLSYKMKKVSLSAK